MLDLIGEYKEKHHYTIHFTRHIIHFNLMNINEEGLIVQSIKSNKNYVFDLIVEYEGESNSTID